MIAVALVAASTALLVQSRIGVDSICVLATRESRELTAAVRAVPDSARSALTRLLARTASAAVPVARAAAMARAQHLASAYAMAWGDSFFVRQIARFARWSASDQLAKVAADSVRRLGGEVLGREGTVPAMRLWYESLRRSKQLGDSAGMAATLGNIASGYYVSDQPDTAEAMLARARTLAERLGDYRTLGNAIGLLANLRRDRGETAEARRLYARALALRQQSGDDRGAAADENNLGMIAQELGDTTAARLAFESALSRNRRGNRSTVVARNLTNLANLASLTGNYERAATLYDEAVRLHRAAGERAELGLVLHNLGLLEVRRADYPAAARSLTTASDLLDATGPIGDAVAARTDLAEALAAMGELDSALAAMRRAERAAANETAPAISAAVAIARADLAFDFNALDDAERLYELAASRFREAGDASGASRATEGLAVLLVRRGQFVRAAGMFETIRRGHDVHGNRRDAALTRLLIGWAQMEGGNMAGAGRTLGQALASLGAMGDPVGEAEALDALGELALRRGRPDVADSLFRIGLARLANRAAPNAAASLSFGLGRALRARGRLSDAAAELRKAIAAVEGSAGRVRRSDHRAAFMADKWGMYAELAQVAVRRGETAEAFEVSERMRARQMLDLLASGRVAPSARIPDSLVAREQDLRRRLAMLETTTDDAPRAGLRLRGPRPADLDDRSAREARAAVEREYGELLVAIRGRSPEYAGLVAGTTVDATEVRRRLRADEALLEYLVSDSTTLLFVVTQRSVRAIDLRITRQSLAAAVDFTRAAIAAPPGDRAPLWRPPLARLRRLLIEPAESAGLLAGIRSLVIVPHAELHYLPFAALLSGDTGRFLVERYELSYVPSASAWVTLASRPPSTTARGALVLAPRPGALPATREEVTAVRRTLGRSTRVLVGAAATGRAFREAAPQYDIIHLASFAVLNKQNPLFSYVELAPDSLGDARLHVHDVFGLALNARLVVLSACQTALASGQNADVPAGDDWTGLVRAFLFAGADNVMATLWPIEDRSTARVIRAFYEHNGADHPAASLARMQRAALRDPATASPAVWAPFVLVGTPH